MWVTGKARVEAERLAGSVDRQHGARREVDAQADHIFGCHARLFEDVWNGDGERAQVISRVLQGPFGRQPCAAARQARVDHAIRVRVDGAGQLGAGADVDQDRATGLGTEVHANGVRTGGGRCAHASSLGGGAVESRTTREGSRVCRRGFG